MSKDKKIEEIIETVEDAFYGDEDKEKSEAENISEIIRAWLDKAYVHLKTRLNGNQIISLTILGSIADKYNVSCINNLITKYVSYKLSEGGQSSKELVDILKHRDNDAVDDDLSVAMNKFMK